MSTGGDCAPHSLFLLLSLASSAVLCVRANKPAGETTELGEPRPKTRFKDQEWEQTARSSGPFQEGWR